MVVKVLKTYRDKQAKTVIAKGTLLDIDDTRAKELDSASGGPYVEAYAVQTNQSKHEVKAGSAKKG